MSCYDITANQLKYLYNRQILGEDDRKNIKEALQHIPKHICKVYSIPKELKELFMRTKNKVIYTYHKLPHPNVFINTEFMVDNKYCKGVLLWEGLNELGNYHISYYSLGDISPNAKVKPTWTSNGCLCDYKGNKEINTLVANFLDYIHDKTVVVKEKPLRSNQWSGEAIPRYTVRLTDRIIKYTKRLKSKGFTVSHTFGVSGHWRHFLSDRYVNVKGERRWIAPYIKGDGKLIGKSYRLT